MADLEKLAKEHEEFERFFKKNESKKIVNYLESRYYSNTSS